MNNEINPITQRCKTISKDHHFEPMWKLGYYITQDGRRVAQDQTVYLNGKKVFECQTCGLVDDLYEGKYK